MVSGANDVIVVKDENGDMKSSPFSVQFGKNLKKRKSENDVVLQARRTFGYPDLAT